MANLRSINLNISSRGLEALRSVDPSLGMSCLVSCVSQRLDTSDFYVIYKLS